MNLALVISAGLLGLAGAPHCAAMCAAPCAALTCGANTGVKSLWFHVARLAGYTGVGAALASGTAVLVSLTSLSAALHPLWTALHAAAFALGLYLLWAGRQPIWLEQLWRQAQPALARPAWAQAAHVKQAVGSHSGSAIVWLHTQGAARAGIAGGLWVALPCGLLQSALMIAALGNGALNGASVMLAFGLTSALGLVIGPAALSRWMPKAVNARDPQAVSTRVAGALLAGASLWAMFHDVFQRAAAYCLG